MSLVDPGACSIQSDEGTEEDKHSPNIQLVGGSSRQHPVPAL